MIISDSHKFIFCRNMRCGTTSIKKRLEKLGLTHIQDLNINSPHYGSHRSMKEIKDLIPEEKFKTYFKFAIVRNPWDRLASLFVYNKLSDATNGTYSIAQLEPHDKWLESVLPQFPDFVRALNNSNYIQYTSKGNQFLNKIKDIFKKPSETRGAGPFSDNFAMPQYDFVRGVDFIGKYEDLSQSFSHISSALNLPFERLKVLNRSFKPSYRSMYDDELKNIVAKHYAKDIKMFEYEF